MIRPSYVSGLLIFICSIWFVISTLQADAPPQQKVAKHVDIERVWTENEAIYWLQQDQGFKERGFLAVGVIDDIGMIRRTLASLADPTRLLQAVISFPMPDDEPDLWDAQLSVFIPYSNITGVREYVENTFGSGIYERQRAAARTLVHWGDWERAWPIIEQGEDFLVFQSIDSAMRPRIAPTVSPRLRDAIHTSSPEGSLSAGYALEALGDTVTLLSVARDVLANAATDDIDEGHARAKYEAMRVVLRKRDASALPEVAKLALDKNVLVRITSVDVLGVFAGNNIPGARDYLEEIATSNPDPRLRQTARETLSTLREEIK